MSWFRRQSATTRALILIALLAAAGIVTRWGHVSDSVAEAFGSRFRKAARTEETTPAEKPAQTEKTEPTETAPTKPTEL